MAAGQDQAEQRYAETGAQLIGHGFNRPAAAAFSFGAAVIAELEASSALAAKPAASSAPGQPLLGAEIGQRQAEKAEGAEQHPPVATSRSPSRDTSRPAIGPLKPLATITGSINIPASNGVFWCTNCSSWAISSSNRPGG